MYRADKYPFSYTCIFALLSTDFLAFGAGYGSSISGSVQYPIFQLRFSIGSSFVSFTLRQLIFCHGFGHD